MRVRLPLIIVTGCIALVGPCIPSDNTLAIGGDTGNSSDAYVLTPIVPTIQPLITSSRSLISISVVHPQAARCRIRIFTVWTALWR